MNENATNITDTEVKYKTDMEEKKVPFFRKYKIKIIIFVLMLANIVACIVAYVFVQSQKSETYEIIQVTTAMGHMEGVIKTSYYNKPYASFSGIPFAVPPIGELRFKSPLPAVQWDGVLDATHPKDPCVQPSINMDAIIGKEDCLYLNVYTPDLSGSLPVLVFVHGGAFMQGSSNDGAETIVDDSIVVVSIAYRLGIFGFLSLNTSKVPGNAGLRDQTLALRWVKDNVKVFGGNPGNVTLMGVSAGAASVSHLQVSPLARGLFHKVVAISGTSLCDFAIQKFPEENTKKLAAILNLNTTQNIEEILIKMPAHDLSITSLKIETNPEGNYEDVTFAPVVESKFEGFEPVLGKQPIMYIKNREFSDVPLIIGYSSKEFVFFYNIATIKSLIEDDRIIVPDRWRLESTETEIKKMAKLIRRQYFKTDSFDQANKEMTLDAVELLGDIIMSQPIIESAKIFSQYSTNQVYLYRFSYRGALNHPTIEHLGIQGAAHVDDKKYFFNSHQTEVPEYSPSGWVRRRFTKILKNFIKIGNPTPGPEDALLPTIWERITPESFNYMEINGDNTPSKDPDRYKTNFWTELERKWRNKEL